MTLVPRPRHPRRSAANPGSSRLRSGLFRRRRRARLRRPRQRRLAFRLRRPRQRRLAFRRRRGVVHDRREVRLQHGRGRAHERAPRGRFELVPRLRRPIRRVLRGRALRVHPAPTPTGGDAVAAHGRVRVFRPERRSFLDGRIARRSKRMIAGLKRERSGFRIRASVGVRARAVPRAFLKHSGVSRAIVRVGIAHHGGIGVHRGVRDGASNLRVERIVGFRFGVDEGTGRRCRFGVVDELVAKFVVNRANVVSRGGDARGEERLRGARRGGTKLVAGGFVLGLHLVGGFGRRLRLRRRHPRNPRRGATRACPTSRAARRVAGRASSIRDRRRQRRTRRVRVGRKPRDSHPPPRTPPPRAPLPRATPPPPRRAPAVRARMIFSPPRSRAAARARMLVSYSVSTASSSSMAANRPSSSPSSARRSGHPPTFARQTRSRGWVPVRARSSPETGARMMAPVSSARSARASEGDATGAGAASGVGSVPFDGSREDELACVCVASRAAATRSAKERLSSSQSGPFFVGGDAGGDDEASCSAPASSARSPRRKPPRRAPSPAPSHGTRNPRRDVPPRTRSREAARRGCSSRTPSPPHPRRAWRRIVPSSSPSSARAATPRRLNPQSPPRNHLRESPAPLSSSQS